MKRLNRFKNMLKNKEYKFVVYTIVSKLQTLTMSEDQKKFAKAMSEKRWDDAISLGESVIENKLADNLLYKDLARANFQASLDKKATLYMRESLYLMTKENLVSFLDWVDRNNLKDYELKSTHLYIGGYHNLGVIMHSNQTDDSNNFITKIIPRNPLTNFFIHREAFFSERLREENHLLESITPKMVASCEHENGELKLLTFEKRGESSLYNVDFKVAFELNSLIINSISYEKGNQIMKEARNRKSTLNPLTMHEEETHVKLIENMYRVASGIKDPDKLISSIDLINRSIEGRKIYKDIIPEEYYVFCHGDFNPGNIIYDEEKDVYSVIDWTLYGFGLRGYDLAKFLIRSGNDFITIRNDYLATIFPSKTKKSELEKIFFVYKLLVLWIASISNSNVDSEIENNIKPAADFLSFLTEDYIKSY